MSREELLAAFRKDVCDKHAAVDPDAERDWMDLSYGYFLAKGATPDEAWEVAIEARYTHGYWLPGVDPANIDGIDGSKP